MDAAALTRTQLAHKIATLTGASSEDVPGAADLAALGLCSLDVMRMVNEWRVLGLPVTYRELSSARTFDAWWTLIERALRVNPWWNAA